MQTIWKYPLPFPAEDAIILMHQGARILALQLQNDIPTLWVELDPALPLITRHFRFYGTGHELSERRSAYVGTFQQPPFVWHVYEE